MSNYLRSRVRPPKYEEKVRVVSHEDGSERFVPVSEARAAYDRGEYGWDKTKRAYYEIHANTVESA